MKDTLRSTLGWVTIAAMVTGSPLAHAGAYIFAGEAFGIDIVTHPLGYTGTGGNLSISVGIDPTSANAADMVIPTQNVINTYNGLVSTTGNLQTANVPFSEYDFESVLLHEMGHAMGLAHCNAATESGLVGNDQNYTKASDGNGSGSDNETAEFNLNDGADNIIGSADDIRDDDVNLVYFRTTTNNPSSLPSTVDGTTYSRNTASLPGADTFAANGDRDVMADLGLANTESVMQQGQFNNEAQRTLLADDIATLRYAMAGVDETQGTSDDYTFTLTYAGLTTSADIVIDFDAGQTGFAVCQTGGTGIAANHVSVSNAAIYMHPTVVTWFFNDVSNGADPDDVYVDFTAGSNGVGTEASPFDNLTDALSFANPAAVINLEPGTSSETFTGGSVINQAATLRNNTPGGGAVVIGN